MRKRKLAKQIEQMMVKEELELHYLDDQHSRAYHTGVIDGLAQVLHSIAPQSPRMPISIVWFDEDYDKPKKLERQRERSFELENSGLFDTAEV